MSNNSTDSPDLWSHIVRGAVTDLRALASASGEDMPPSALEDLQRIFSLAITLEEQLAAPSTHHDLMNT
ncbi:MAG TPA: hypothetical protein DD808_11380, partial [Halieaceae bacterium]|nr:hypothetical protein [Halieaceae bacterium]HBQ41155.1 hypothetical protein [Halieaceae bacterium]HBX74162.1 hypothetical protein [Halieaceae bacterium]